ncbi:MAG: hypothetical protein EOS10_06230 [Mesorhizobium sp.]|uniref:hypothetical protein n=1 Tax=Mesorhizobium sp. TaxID=1871066 RepID=UPI000FE9D208|nr:hypothetical protein [Mesorhizobium sp.]RWO33317.1 MAG: hypothetical protein EOS10_06230 [Mesorhizobium sp.]
MATRDAGRLDPVTDDANWADWSIVRLEAASLNGPLLINDAVYAELAVRYDRTPVSRPLLRAACA